MTRVFSMMVIVCNDFGILQRCKTNLQFTNKKEANIVCSKFGWIGWKYDVSPVKNCTAKKTSKNLKPMNGMLFKETFH